MKNLQAPSVYKPGDAKHKTQLVEKGTRRIHE